MEKIYEAWAKRNPEWETKFAESIVNIFTDYGKGTSQYLESRGKIFGAGYEIFIIAFFIGLYLDKKTALTNDKSKRKVFGQAIQYWGNIETRHLRQTYGQIRYYIFAALIAKTDIDFIALDKGDVSLKSAVDSLMQTMEEYANTGFYFLDEKLTDDPNCYFKDRAFFNTIMEFIPSKRRRIDYSEADAPESLD